MHSLALQALPVPVTVLFVHFLPTICRGLHRPVILTVVSATDEGSITHGPTGFTETFEWLRDDATILVWGASVSALVIPALQGHLTRGRFYFKPAHGILLG